MKPRVRGSEGSVCLVPRRAYIGVVFVKDCHRRLDVAGLGWALRPCMPPSKGPTTEFHPHGLISIWAWWAIPVNPALRRLRQEGHEFKTSQGVRDRYGRWYSKQDLCVSVSVRYSSVGECQNGKMGVGG